MAKTLWSRRKFLLRTAQGAASGCGARCPNGIPIAKRLADLKAVFN